ncbi:Immediate early protein ICP0 [Stigmatella sp. ncwal1]|uniref:Immediate early protein ICP0 n=1 Tax=Stigmatella ashevillensis TaxID=2995309 RepID=A0ABT5DHF5_9BACT|nr:Immediate early protein ICP0 [Stigmatella ashevillena]MDC0712956.1 Immediate early protein ICP0 [Stigmatella ashevillena]
MATLIMPRVEVPAAPGGKMLPSESPQQAPQGPPVSPMDTPIGRGGGTRIVKMPEAPGGKDRTGEGTLPGGSGRPSKGSGTTAGGSRQTRDGFGAVPTTGNRPALGQGEARGRVLPVGDLVPKGLEKLLSQEGVAKRFASDLALLHQQLRPSEMPSSERALRAWAFFTAYAEASAAHEPTQEGRETFDKALKDQGFGELRDAHTGEDGLASAQWVLEASNPEEARARAEQVQPEPPPEVRLSESAQPPEAPPKPSKKEEAPPAPSQESRDNAFTQGPERPALERIPGQAEFVRMSPLSPPPQVLVPARTDAERLAEDEPPLDRWKGRAKRLGRNMLWNVLHRFRAGPEDSAIEKEKWDQIAFGAVMAIVGMMILIILLVCL